MVEPGDADDITIANAKYAAETVDRSGSSAAFVGHMLMSTFENLDPNHR